MNDRRYRLLGPVTAYDGPRKLELGSPKQLSVLAVLLLSANRVVAEDQLIALVWGDAPPRSVRGRLQVYISELRTQLGKDLIERTGAGYRLLVRPGELDLDRYDAKIGQARVDRQAGRTGAAAEHLRSALALWAGPALGGTGEILAGHHRAALEERRLDALEDLFEDELSSGRPGRLIGELRQAVDEHPLRERLRCLLMLALHRSGRTPEALRVYDEARLRLIEELGVEPGQALRAMQQLVLAGDDTQTTSDDPPVLDKAGWNAPAELPRDIRGFTERGASLDELDAQLAAGDSVIVISGPAGVGKTALAVHWAHRVRENFPDGQLYLNLRGFDPELEPLTPTAAISQLLWSLGVNAEQLPGDLDRLAALYRTTLTDRRVLVVLDNARDTQQVQSLLSATGTTLVTSRHRLTGLTVQPGARSVALAVLDDRGAYGLIEGVVGKQRLEAEPVAAAALIRLCGGLPLALRLAAAKVATEPMGGVAAVVAELSAGGRLAGLAVDGSPIDGVTAAFAASYRALAGDLQRMFRLLGLIPGPDFTPAAAASLANVPLLEATRSLNGLAAAHLVEQHMAGRFRLHDLVRLYAADQARSDAEAPAAWTRLLEHYCRIARAVVSRYSPGALQLPNRRLALTNQSLPGDEAATPTTELHNLVAALRHAIAHGPHHAAWALAEALGAWFHQAGRRAEWLELAPLVLNAARQRDEREVQAMVHHAIGISQFRDRQLDYGVQHLQAAVRLARDCGWREGEATAMVSLSTSLAWTGDLGAAVVSTKAAAELFAELASPAGESRTLNALGGQYHHLGKLFRAEDSYREAAALSHKHGLWLQHANDQMGLGSVLLDLGRLQECETALLQAVDLFGELGSDYGASIAHTWLSRLRWEVGDHQRAQLEAGRALELARQQNTTVIEAAALVALADAQIGLHAYREAERHLNLAFALISGHRLGWHLAQAAAVAARLYSRQGDHLKALEQALVSQRAAQTGGYRPAEMSALLALIEVYAGLGATAKAADAEQAALALSAETGQTGEQRIHRLLAERGQNMPLGSSSSGGTG